VVVCFDKLCCTPAVLAGGPVLTWRTSHPAGVSFLPYDCGSYKQTPYEAVDQDVYEELRSRMPESIDWTQLARLERTGGEERCEYELACSATGGCEMVDVP